ncbi:hypothetical protein MCOR31_011177 [Pyricularia oryzae]|nr:hypothetical protein MCOR31_011177 [Pyricularia oryzae]
MAPKIFFTGATGFVGGDVLEALHSKHPDYEYTILVRTEERAKPVRERYSDANVIIGSNDSAEIIEKAAAEADVVVHTAESADDEPSAKSIVKGLEAGHSPDRPGRYIHLTGTAILQWYDKTNERYGEPPAPDQEYRDIRDIERILNLPDQAPHRGIDKIVQAANDIPYVKTAMICPPVIYGTGRGTVNTRSQQVPFLARYVLQEGHAPLVGAQKTQWDSVHVADLATLFVALVEAALDPGRRDDPELFGRAGYFFCEAGTPHRWSDVARAVVEAAKQQGFVAEARAEVVPAAKVTNWTLLGNSQSVAERARKHLGWEPEVSKRHTLWDDIPNCVKVEAEALGIKPTLPPQ